MCSGTRDFFGQTTTPPVTLKPNKNRHSPRFLRRLNCLSCLLSSADVYLE